MLDFGNIEEELLIMFVKAGAEPTEKVLNKLIKKQTGSASPKTIRILIDHGAKPTKKTLQLAVEKNKFSPSSGDGKIVKMLLNEGIVPTTKMLQNARQDHIIPLINAGEYLALAPSSKEYNIRPYVSQSIKIQNEIGTMPALSDWRERLEKLRDEQGLRNLHLKDESVARNREILAQFMSIFKATPERDREQLINETLLPDTFGKADRKTALPLHSVAYLADDRALKDLRPYISADDVAIKGPFNSTLIHMIISGIQYKATNGSAVECVKILTEIDPSLVTKQNQFGLTPKDYARYVSSTNGDETKSQIKNIITLL